MGDDLPYLDDGHDFSLMSRIDCTGSECFVVGYYDSTLLRLHMKFVRKGRANPSGWYTWAGVPKGKVAAMRNAGSKGKFYHAHIEGNYHTNFRL